MDLVVLFCLLTFVLPTITNHAQNRQTTQSNANPIIAIMVIHPCHWGHSPRMSMYSIWTFNIFFIHLQSLKGRRVYCPGRKTEKAFAVCSTRLETWEISITNAMDKQVSVHAKAWMFLVYISRQSQGLKAWIR